MIKLKYSNLNLKIFNYLDINFDSEFNIHDLMSLDEESAMKLNTKLQLESDKFQNFYENQLNKFKDV